MLYFTKGNIFDSSCQVIVNPVNTVGVMGAGLALQFKKNYPKMFESYRSVCERNLLEIGTLQIVKVSPSRAVLNFPTKKHWRDKSQVSYVEEGLQKFVATYKSKNIQSIAFPRIASGLGGLDWESQVKPLMIKYLEPLDIKIEIYE